jgi:sugar phosphate isomerase/epimerase
VTVGICCWAFAGFLRGRRTLAEVTQAAGAAGFSSVEGVYAQRTAAGGARLTIPDLAVPVTSLATLELHRFELTDPVDAKRARARAAVHAMIDIARRENIPSVSFSPGRVPSDRSVDQTLDALVEELRPFVQSARDAGVRLCLENLPGHVLERRDAMTRVLDALPDADVCFDCGNALLDPPQADWLRALGPRIHKIHVSDGHVVSGRFEACVPGDGQTNWAEVSFALRSLPRAPELFVEAMWPNAADEHAFLADLHVRAMRAVGAA